MVIFPILALNHNRFVMAISNYDSGGQNLATPFGLSNSACGDALRLLTVIVEKDDSSDGRNEVGKCTMTSNRGVLEPSYG